MAKGQLRSTREIRKPKKDKAAPKVEAAFSKQLLVANASVPGKKGRGS